MAGSEPHITKLAIEARMKDKDGPPPQKKELSPSSIEENNCSDFFCSFQEQKSATKQKKIDFSGLKMGLQVGGLSKWQKFSSLLPGRREQVFDAGIIFLLL